MTELGLLIERAAEERAAAERRLLDRLQSGRQPDRIGRRTVTGAVQLSFAQQRLWLQEQAEQASPVNGLMVTLALRGVLDVPALELSLDEIVRRHEALRTTFSLGAGQPMQAVSPHVPVRLPRTDISGDDDPPGRAAALARLSARKPFDLERGSLFRPQLLRLAADDHLLLLGVHHIAADGWSLRPLYRELSRLYEAFSAGLPALLAPLPLQYADFALWQRQDLQGKRLAALLQHWRQQLLGAPTVLTLPAARPRQAISSSRGHTVQRTLPRQLVQHLLALSAQEGASLFMTLLAGFYVLLHSYTGQRDLLVGVPSANRTRSEIEDLIGFFVNVLVLRGDLRGDPSFSELLERVRRASLAAYEHQDLPFELLVQDIRPDRDPSRPPLVQVLFQLFAEPREPLSLTGLDVVMDQVPDESANADLTLVLIEDSGGAMRAIWRYSTDLFDEQAIHDMHDRYQRLLAGVAACPQARLAELAPNGEASRPGAPGRQPADGGSPASVAPGTDAEAKVAAVFAELLGRPSVGIHDGFFDLGGNSALAARVIDMLRRQFVTLPVPAMMTAFFEAPTVAGFTAALGQLLLAEAGRQAQTA